MALWNDDEDKLLIDLHKKGYSASKIAQSIFGKSRNAVIGRIHRLGLAREGLVMSNIAARHAERRFAEGKSLKRGRPHAIVKKAAPVVAKPLPAPAEPYVEPSTDDVATRTLVTLERDECRWPIGDPKTEAFGFCGCKIVPGLPYCDRHRHRAYQPVSPARKSIQDSVPADVSVRQREGVS